MVRPPRYSLRLLLIFLSAAAVLAAVYGRRWRQDREIEAVLAGWTELGAWVGVKSASFQPKGEIPRPIDLRALRIMLSGPLDRNRQETLSRLLARTAKLPGAGFGGLYLEHVNVTLEDAQAIGRLPGLRELALVDAGLTDDHLAAIARAEDLVSLMVGDNDIGDDGAAALAGATKLESLSIEANPVTEFALNDLQEALPGLEVYDD